MFRVHWHYRVIRPCSLNTVVLYCTMGKGTCAFRLSNFDKIKPGNLTGRLEELINLIDENFIKIPDHCDAKLVPFYRSSMAILARLGWDGQVVESEWKQESDTPTVQNWKIVKLGVVLVARVFASPYQWDKVAPYLHNQSLPLNT